MPDPISTDADATSAPVFNLTPEESQSISSQSSPMGTGVEIPSPEGRTPAPPVNRAAADDQSMQDWRNLPENKAAVSNAKAMLYSRQDLGGKAPQAVLKSKMMSDPQEFRDGTAAVAGMSALLGLPSEAIVGNFDQFQNQIEGAMGWDHSSSVSGFANNLASHFQTQDQQHQAIQELQAKAVNDAVTFAGKGMSPNPLVAYSDWNKTAAEAFKNFSEAQKLQIFNSVYLPVQKQMSSPVGQAATKLVDALTENADAKGIPEQGADKTEVDQENALMQGKEAPAPAEKIDPVQFLKGMPEDQQNQVINLAAQLMAAKQPEMSNGMKVIGGLGQAFAQGFTSWDVIGHLDALVDAEQRLKAAQTPEDAQKARDDIENIKIAQKIKQADQSANTVQPELYGFPKFAYEAGQGVAGMPGSIAPAFVPVLGEFAFYKQAQAQDALKLMEQNPGMTAEEAKSKTTVASAAYGITMGRLAGIFGEASPGLAGFLKHTAQGTLVMQGAEGERILGQQLQSMIDPSFNKNEDYGKDWLDLLKSTPTTFVTLAAFGGMVKLLEGKKPVDPNSAAELEKQAGNPRILQYLGFTQEMAEKVAALPEGQRLKALAGEWGNRTDEMKQAGVELAKQDAADANQTLAEPDAPKVEQTPDGKYVITTKQGDETHQAVFDTQEGAQKALEIALTDHQEKNAESEPTNDWVTSTEENPGKKPTPKEATASILQGFIDKPESAQLLQHEDGTWSVIWHDKDSNSLQYITFDSKEEALAWHEQNKGKEAPSVDTHVDNVSERLGREFGGTLPTSVEVVHEPDANWNAKIQGGKIQVNAAHVDPEQAVHEMNEELSHAAWRESGVQDLFQQLWDSADQALKDSITDLVQKLYGDQPADIQHEETRAKLVKEILKLRDNPESKGAWDKFVEAIKAIWEKLTGAPVTNPEAIAAKIIEIGKAKIEGVDNGIRYSLNKPHDSLKEEGDSFQGKKIESLVKVPANTKSHLVEQAFKNLDAIHEAIPEPLASDKNWRTFARAILGQTKSSSPVIMPPERAMGYSKGVGIDHVTNDLLKHPEFVDARKSGLAIGVDFLKKLRAGELGREDLASLFTWGLLSRGVGAYPQEGGFLALHRLGLHDKIRDIFDGKATAAEINKWAKDSISGTAGASTSHNALKVGDQLAALATDINGRKAIDVLLDAWRSDMSGPELRRAIHSIFTDDRPSVQIDNKVLSFIALVSGRPDVMVLDRVQFRHLWGGEKMDAALNKLSKEIIEARKATIEKYGADSEEGKLASKVDENATNAYDSLPVILDDGTFQFGTRAGKKLVSRTGINSIGNGLHGLAVYEAIERSIEQKISEAYKNAGIEYPGLGAFHWDSWLVESQQAIKHPTIALIAKTDMSPSLGVAEGKFNTARYGVIYRFDGQYMRELLTKPGEYAMFDSDQINALNADKIFKAIGRQIPLANDATGAERTRPWTDDLTPEERAKFDDFLKRNASGIFSPRAVDNEGGSNVRGRNGSSVGSDGQDSVRFSLRSAETSMAGVRFSLKEQDLLDLKKPLSIGNLSPETLKLTGYSDKPVVLKPNILQKNRIAHPELSDSQSVKILNDAIGNPDLLIKSKPNDKPNYWAFISFGEKSSSAVVELSETKNSHEIVNWFPMEERSVVKQIERAGREGGQVLITTKGRSAALSDLPPDSKVNIALEKNGVNVRYSKRPEPIIGDIPPPKTQRESLTSCLIIRPSNASRFMAWRTLTPKPSIQPEEITSCGTFIRLSIGHSTTPKASLVR